MRDVLAKLGRHGLVFSIGLLLSRLVGFVVLPFLTRSLDEWQYGVHDLLAQTGMIVGMIAALGLPSAVFRWYVYEAETPEDRRRALATGFRATAVSSVIVGLLLALPATPIARELAGGRTGFASLYVLILLTYVMQNLRNVCISILRAEYRSTQFLIVYCVEFLLCVGLNLWLVVGLRLGVAGLVWSNLIGAAVALALGMAFVPGVWRGGSDRAMLRRMIGFGAPLVPQALAFFLLDSLDRYCLNGLLDDGADVVGLYGRGAQFATILHAALILPFTTLWPNVFYELAKREDGPRDIGRFASYYAVVAGFLAAGLAACGEPLVRLMTDAKYHSCHVVVPILALSIVLFGANEFPRVGFLVKSRTRMLPVLVGVAVVVNLALNLALIPRYGMLGAAWASVGAYVVLVLLHARFGQRLYRLEYEWGRIAKATVATAAALALAWAWPSSGSALADLFLRGGTVAVAQPLLVLASGFLTPGEKSLIREKLTRKRASSSD
ncbi:MAG: lipopolysaccharide biosynthesis protein [Planctomycetota bacterium JB042]